VKGQIEQKGLVPPEKIFLKEKFDYLMKELARRGISIKIVETTVQEKNF